MPHRNEKPSVASTLATLAGCAMVAGSLLLTLAFPQLHLAIALAIGSVLGAPFIVWGLRLHPHSNSAETTPRPFWPVQTEARSLFWGFVAGVTLLTCFIGPIAVVVSVSYLLPSGDHWGIVAIRLAFIVLSILGWYGWVQFASQTIPPWFRGKLSDATLDAILRDKPPEEPKTAKAAAIKNWQLAVIALVAFCVAFQAIDFNGPWLNIDGGPKRTRTIVRLLQWCRGNPNTIRSSSALVGTAALAWYLYRIRRAVMIRANVARTSTETVHSD
jgi:hypothetical protein